MKERITIKKALKRLESQEQELAVLFKHGSLEVEFYAPKGKDSQRPHSRNELYVIASGHGKFFCNGNWNDFETGEVIFVPAGAEHHFENFSDDFATWVFFYGPEGGNEE